MADFCDCIYKGTEHPHEHCPSKLRGSTCVHECVKAQAKAIAAKDGGIKYLRALVKELADALDKRVCRIKDCRTECGAGMGACMDIDHRELVDKAREVLNG